MKSRGLRKILFQFENMTKAFLRQIRLMVQTFNSYAKSQIKVDRTEKKHHLHFKQKYFLFSEVAYFVTIDVLSRCQVLIMDFFFLRGRCLTIKTVTRFCKNLYHRCFKEPLIRLCCHGFCVYPRFFTLFRSIEEMFGLIQI